MNPIENLIRGVRSYTAKLHFRHPHVTHAGTFLIGVLLTFGVVGLDAMFHTTTYRKSGAASVIGVVVEQPVFKDTNEASTTTTTSQEDQTSSETPDESGVQSETSEDTLLVSNAGVTGGTSDGGAEASANSASAEEARAALEQAQTVLEELNQQKAAAETQNTEEEEAPAYFTTPSGITIDENGNVVDPNTGTTETTASSQTTTNTNVLPEGVYQLPNGQLVYADGTVYKGQVDTNTTYVQQDPTDGYYTSPSGAVFDRNGNLISLPPKEEEKLIPPTDIDPNNPPEFGSTIYIPVEVASWSYNNPLYGCEVNFYQNDRELCQLYRDHPDDYDWVTVKTEN